MSWLVVKFDADNTVEAVPNTWYVKENFQCYWPSEGTPKNIIIDFIKKKQSPQANWTPYNAVVLGYYDDYKVAQKKANKAKNTNNLSSNTETFKQKRRSKRRTKTLGKYHKNLESNSEQSSETEKSSLDDTAYPDINKIQSSNSTITPPSCVSTVETTMQHQSPLILGHTTEFEKRVFRELHILSLKIDDVTESLNVLIKNKAESHNLPVYNKVPDIIELFPVNNESLIELENWLTSSEENKAILSENLSRIGGLNVKEIVRRIMYRVFTNEVGMCFSWDGAKKKKAFKNLAIATTILSAVRRNKNSQNCTDMEVISFIKAWLVRSKDRFNNNKNKEIDGGTSNNEENQSTHDSQQA